MSKVRGAPRRVLAVWCPDWLSGAPDAGPEARAFEQVVAAVEELCPRVEVVRPGTCAIGATGPARYFGSEEALARKITDAVAALGFACRAGVADGLFAAQLAARASAARASAAPVSAGRVADGDTDGAADRASAGGAADRAGPPWVIVAPGETPAFLAPYPVTALDVPELTDLLPRLGIWTLGDFARLPAAGAANRFGLSGARAHRLARGLDPRPLAPRQPAADLSVHAEFDPPADQAEPVVFAAKALAERMHAGLASRGLACVRVQVQATCEDGQEITRLWRHDGLLSALAVAERVRWQLAGWRAGRDARGDAGGTRGEAGDARGRGDPRSGEQGSREQGSDSEGNG